MAPKPATLAIYVTLLVYYSFILTEYQRIFGSDNTTFTSELYKVVRQFRGFFFTGWNFSAQTLFLLVAVADESSTLLKLNQKLRFLNSIRNYFFSTIIFPSTLLVFSMFWSLYVFNRELIFPKSMEEFYPEWLNQSVHGLIIFPLILELYLVKETMVKLRNALIGFCTFLLCYQLLLLLVYVFNNVWIYPIFMHMTWTQRFLFTIMVQGVGASYLYLGIYLQNIRKSMNQNKIK